MGTRRKIPSIASSTAHNWARGGGDHRQASVDALAAYLSDRRPFPRAIDDWRGRSCGQILALGGLLRVQYQMRGEPSIFFQPLFEAACQFVIHGAR